MSFYQQHNIIGDNNTPGVSLLDAQSGARVEEQRLKGNNATIALLATNQFGKRPRRATGPAVPGGRFCHKICPLVLIWEAQNPEKAAKRAKLRTRTPQVATPVQAAALTQHAAVAATAATRTRASNLF
jgi:hypothetical protein